MNALKQLHIYQIPHSQLAVCALPWFCKYWNKSTVLQPVVFLLTHRPGEKVDWANKTLHLRVKVNVVHANMLNNTI